MNKYSSLVIAVLIAGLVGPLSAAEKVKSADQARYETVRAAADSARKEASAAGGEWRDIGKILKKADGAASKGDFAAATKLAEKAEFQAKMGRAQALSQKGLSTPAYMR